MEAMSDLVAMLTLLIFVVMIFGGLFLPTIIARYRKHNNLGAIFVTNLVGMFFFGIGWIIALVWSLTDNVDIS